MQDKISKSVTFLSVFIFAVASVYLQSISLCVGLLVFAVLLAWAKGLLSRRFGIVLMFVFTFGVFYTSYRTPTSDVLQKYIFKETQITGTVKSVPKYKNHKIKFYFDVQRIPAALQASKSLGTTSVSVFSDESAVIHLGDELTLDGKFAVPYPAKNLGQFDYADYLRKQGVFTVFYAKKYHVVGQSSDWFLRSQVFFDKITQDILKKHSKYLSREQSDLLGGVVFGHKSVELDDSVEQNFINSGIFHVLAASGMQIGLVLFFWYFLMRFLRVPYIVSLLSGAVLIVIYAGFTGFPPSILRALLMAEFIIFGKLLDRQADNIALLLLVCSIMLLQNPLSIMDVGFQLSFVTTFGLLFCMPRFIGKIKFLPEVVSGTLVMTLVAQAFASPLLIYYFNNLSLYSLFANIAIVPFVSMITFIGFASSFVALVPHSAWLIKISSMVLAPFLSGMNFVAEFFANLPSALLYIRQINILSVIILYLLIVFCILAIDESFENKKFNVVTLLSLFLFLMLNVNFVPQKNLEIVFFDVGNSDAILVKLPNKKQFLVDTGRANLSGASSGKTVIAEYLKAVGKKNLDAIILTHPDADHIGGCCDVLKFAKVGTVYQGCTKGNSCIYNGLQDYLTKNKFSVCNISRGSIIDLPLDKSVKIKLFVPKGDCKNANSLITYIEYGNFSALLMGDSEKEAMPFLASKIKKPISVLKVGHHGSKGAVDEKMLNILHPKTVVISVGKNNFGHPDFETLNVLEKHSIRVYRTDWDNMILFSSQGTGFAVKKYYSYLKNIE